jgi:CheY-like chemotaxis protein
MDEMTTSAITDPSDARASATAVEPTQTPEPPQVAADNRLAIERRVLIIDDDRSMCDVLHIELEKRGFSAVATTSSDEAMRKLADEDFGLVLTDINMQGMSGVDLCRQIAQHREDIPVVVMTALPSVRARTTS